MYLIGGPTKKTCAATLGTLAGVVLAGLSAWCFSNASGISGYNVSDIETLMTLWNTNRIQVGGLLFSGLLPLSGHFPGSVWLSLLPTRFYLLLRFF